MNKANAKSLVYCSLLLIVTFIVFFITNGLALISDHSPWTGFILSTVLSVGAFSLSVLAIVKEYWLQRAYITALISYFLILFTIFIFIIPEAGIPGSKPLILQLIIYQF